MVESVRLARAEHEARHNGLRPEETEWLEALCLSCLAETDTDPTFQAEVFEGEIVDACPECGSQSVCRA